MNVRGTCMVDSAVFSDHFRIVSVPLGNAIIEFTCPACKYSMPFYLFEDKPVPATFGECPRCKAKMHPGSFALDVDKLLALLKKAHGIKIIIQ